MSIPAVQPPLPAPAVAAAAATLSSASSALAPLAEVIGADLTVPLVPGGVARYVNLDYAASAPALRAVADRVADLLPLYASVHRGAGYASAVCTSAYEAARAEIARFVDARDDDVVIFTRNTTDALNLLAGAVPADRGGVLHLDIEHHANLLPWQRTGSRVVRALGTREQTVAAVEAALAASPAALLAVTGASNVTGECPPLAELTALAHRHGARIVVDGAQLLPHRRVALARSGVDYLAFSGHKLYAPYGAGVLVGRRDWLEAAAPYLAGGGAVRAVRLGRTEWAAAPARHEAGTPHVVGAVALAAACRALAALGPEAISAHERALAGRLAAGLAAIGGVRLLRLWPAASGEPAEADPIGVLTFTVDGYPAALVAQYLSAEHGIGVRDGRFCAHPLLARLTADAAAGATADRATADRATAAGATAGATADRATADRATADGTSPRAAITDGAGVRASLGLGSRSEDVDRLLAALALLRARGPVWNYAAPAGGCVPVPDPRALPEWLTSAVAGPAAACAGALAEADSDLVSAGLLELAASLIVAAACLSIPAPRAFPHRGQRWRRRQRWHSGGNANADRPGRYQPCCCCQRYRSLPALLLLPEIVRLLAGEPLGLVPVQMAVAIVGEVLLDLRHREAGQHLLAQLVVLDDSLALAVVLVHAHRLEAGRARQQLMRDLMRGAPAAVDLVVGFPRFVTLKKSHAA